jgi:hypothetical protein
VSINYQNDSTGTGADGAITIAGAININTQASIVGRTSACVDGAQQGDAVNYSVTALSATSATVSPAPSTGCLAVGDEILLINLNGTTASFVHVGEYETLRVQSIAGNVITFTTSKKKYYGSGVSDDAGIGTTNGTQRVMLQRVPNYTNVTVNAGASLYPSTYNNAKGGVVFFRATGNVSVAGNSTINANATGWLGGYNDGSGGGGGAASYCGGRNTSDGSPYAAGHGGYYTNSPAANTGLCGGGGGGAASGYNNTNTGYAGAAGSSITGGAGGGGGGGWAPTAGYYVFGGSGGGGGHATAGGGGDSYQGGNGEAGGILASGDGGVGSYNGGHASGGGGGGGGTLPDPADGSELWFGSGGGNGGYGKNAGEGQEAGGAGGAGGGIVYIAANDVSIAGGVQAIGGAGTSGPSGCTWGGGGGGGGAGGYIKIIGNTLTLGTNLVHAGGGGAGSCAGGSGGVGRVAVGYNTALSGATYPAATDVPVSNNAAVFISNEIATPNAVDYRRISWLADTTPYGIVSVQTRSGASNNSTDGSWEAWKPAAASATILSDANDHTLWSPNNSTIIVADGDVARNINYYEDEDEAAVGNTTKLTTTSDVTAYAEARIGATDLSSKDFITLWVYSSGAGNAVKIGFGENNSSEHEQIVSIDAVNTWQKVYWDISHIPYQERDAVRLLKVGTMVTGNSIRFDQFAAQSFYNTASGSTITSTPNEYLQYRVILATSNPGFNPTLYNIQAEWSDGYKIEQTTNNTVRLYNYTGSTQQLRLDAVVFGADLAEWYTVEDDTIGAADVVSITGKTDIYGVPILRRATGPNDAGLLGGISTQAGKELGLKADNRRLLGLAGRIPIKIDPQSPAILYGDYLTASSEKPGYAVKALPGDTAIAKAFQPWSPNEGQETLLSLVVQPQPVPLFNFEPISNYLFEKTIQGLYTVRDTTTNAIVKTSVALANAVIGNLKAGSVKTEELEAKTATINHLSTDFISPISTESGMITIQGDLNVGNITNLQNIQIGTSSGSLSALVIKGLNNTPVVRIDGEGNASFSGTLAARGVTAETATISGALIAKTIQSENISTLETNVASLSALLASNTTAFTSNINAVQQELSDIKNIQLPNPAYYQNIDKTYNDLTVNGTANMYKAHIADSLVVGSLFIQPSSILALSSDLRLSSLGTISLFNDTVVIAKNGDITSKGEVVAASLAIKNVEGKTVASIDSSGSAKFNEVIAKKFTLENIATQGAYIADSGITNANNMPLPGIQTNAEVAGTGIVPRDQREIVIFNESVTANSLIYLTPTSESESPALSVAKKLMCPVVPNTIGPTCRSYFTVRTGLDIHPDILFNWLIIN